MALIIENFITFKIKIMWQKCPICDGTGRTQNTNSTSNYSVCSTCNGSKLISRLTGLPPNYEMNKKEEAERQKEIDEIINKKQF